MACQPPRLQAKPPLQTSLELSWLVTKRFRAFNLFAENSQIHLKFSVIPINFYVSGSTESVSKQSTQLIIVAHICHNKFQQV